MACSKMIQLESTTFMDSSHITVCSFLAVVHRPYYACIAILRWKFNSEVKMCFMAILSKSGGSKSSDRHIYLNHSTRLFTDAYSIPLNIRCSLIRISSGGLCTF